MNEKSCKEGGRKRGGQGGKKNAARGRLRKGHTFTGEEHGAGAVETWLQRLPATLIGRLWPAERVVLGVRVSKGIRRDLLLQAEKVELIASDCGRVNPCRISASLKRFEKTNIALAWSNPETIQLLLKGMAVAALAGCCRTLTTLDLADNDIGPEAMGLLSGVLAGCQSLKHLNLDRNGTGAIGAQYLAEVLEDNSGIESLGISSNMLHTAGAQTLANSLARCVALKRLDASENELGDAGADIVAEALLQAKQLNHLDMRDNKLSSAGVEKIALLLRSCSSLQHLNLSRNPISVDGAQKVAPALASCSNLTCLHLGFARLQEGGASALASTFPHLPALTLLDLAGNAIRDGGLALFAASLSARPSPALSLIDLSSNEISPASAPHLAALLGQSASSLRDVLLSDNALGDTCIGVLAPVLRRCSQLKHLDLVSTSLTLAGLELLLVELAAEHRLPFINVAGNQFGDVGVRMAQRSDPEARGVTTRIRASLKPNVE